MQQVSELSNYDRCQVFCLRIDTVISLIADAIQTNEYLILAEIKGCKIRDWIVGKLGIRISRILYSIYVYKG